VSGIIYILTNEAMPGYIKIGKTNNLGERIRTLSGKSCVPFPFDCVYACTVKDVDSVERKIHDIFKDYRAHPKREFFTVSPKRVVSAMKLVEIEEVTPPSQDYVETQDDKEALEKARKRRENLNFKMVGIEIGSVLTYVKDESITAKVINSRQIEWNGETTSLSASAQKLLDSSGPVQGTRYWMYEGKTLDEYRNQLEFEE